MKKVIFLITALFVLMSSCSNDTDSHPTEESKVIKFSSANNQKSTGTWKAGDEIYILMKKAGVSTGNYADWFPYNQKPVTYVTVNGDGMFTPKTPQDELFFPENGDAVHFIAYAPSALLADEGEDLTVPVALPTSDGVLKAGILDATIFYQEDQSKIDIILARNLTDKTKNDGNTVQLEFEHVMSKLEFNISVDGVLTENDLVGLKVHVKGLFSTGRNYMASNTAWEFIGRTVPEPPVYFNVSSDGKSAEATLLPYRLTSTSPSNSMSKDIIFELANGEEYVWTFDTDNLVQGVKNTYNIILKKKGNTKVALEEGEATITDWDNNPIEDVTIEK